MQWVDMLDILDFFSPVAAILAALFGLLIGSFLNVVIYRVPQMMEREWTQFAKSHLGIALTEDEQAPFNLQTPRSHCRNCGATVKAQYNIPVFSYLLLRGRCANCRVPIGLRYPLVELLTAVLFAAVASRFGWTLAALGGLVLTAFLIALAFIDYDTQYLPDQLTQPMIWLGLLFNVNHTFVSLESSVSGAVAGYMSLWLLNAVFKLFTGKNGMGNGDFKLLAALGAWLGAGVLPLLVLAASVIGLFGALVMRVAKGQYFAFGPSLAIVGWAALIWQHEIQTALNWWLAASGF